MAEGARALSHAVRPMVVAKYLAQLGFVLALLTLVPLAASLCFTEYAMSLRYTAVIAVLLLLAWWSRRVPAPANLQQNEALVIVALAFVLSPLLMSLPLSGAGLGWNDAIFEAISAVTTTGLSTLADVESMSPGFLFARSWTQWYGGLGIVVLSIALLQGHYVASRRLIEPMAGEGLETTTRTFARRSLTLYVAMTVVAIGCLMLLGMDGVVAIEHALSAVSTGGFSPYNDSLAHLADKPQIAAVVFIGLLGAVPFHLYWIIRQRGLKSILNDSELWLLLLLIAVVAMVLAAVLHHSGMSWASASFHGVVQAVSAQTTSGFASLSLEELGNVGKLSLIVGMFVGGGMGSTAGGIKLLRLLILLKVLQQLLQRSAMPSSAVTVVKLEGNLLSESNIQAALTLILLFLLVVLASWSLFLAYGYPPMDALFEVVSASATVGLSAGITSASLEPVLRLVLCVDMLLGRLEIFAMLVLLYPPTWFGKRAEG